MKLYSVTLKDGYITYDAFVVADDPTDAGNVAIEKLESERYKGSFRSDWRIESVKLFADEYQHAKPRLFIKGAKQ